MICCKQLNDHLNNVCEQHKGNCPDSPFNYNPKMREFSVKLGEYWIYPVHGEILVINNCPFCGYKFPDSLRDKYFEDMEKLGINPWINEVPEEYKSDKWWNK